MTFITPEARKEIKRLELVFLTETARAMEVMPLK